MRIALAKYGQETNSFSSTLTTISTFQKFGMFEGEDFLESGISSGPIAGLFDACRDAGFSWEPIPLIRGWAGASGKITEATHQFFVGKITDGLSGHENLDGLFLDLHGAAQAVHLDDCEGNLIEQCRAIIGADKPIVVALDHHANVTQKMVDHADAIVAHRTQPHDPYDTGYQAGQLLVQTLRREAEPVSVLQKIPMLTHQEQFLTTPAGPMREWFELARQLEQSEGVLSISPCPMQPWLDISEAGWAVIVVADADEQLARKTANQLAEFAWENRQRFMQQTSVSPAIAVTQAIETEGFVVLSDTGDSVFGGAPGDSTILLKLLLENPIEQDCLVPMVDPGVVAEALEAGPGASLSVSVGGKQDSVFSSPAEVDCVVAGTGGGRIRVDVIGNDSYDAGRAVLLRCRNVLLAVTETEGIGGNHPICYEQFGVDVSTAKLAVLKTASNFQYYSQFQPTIIRADTDGMTMSGVNRLPWNQLSRPIFPLDKFD